MSVVTFIYDNSLFSRGLNKRQKSLPIADYDVLSVTPAINWIVST